MRTAQKSRRFTRFLKHGTRYNDTTTGRWTTTDPITRLADPNQANPYHYAGNNPCNNTDPTGKDLGPAFGCLRGAGEAIPLAIALIPVGPELPALALTTGCALGALGAILFS